MMNWRFASQSYALLHLLLISGVIGNSQSACANLCTCHDVMITCENQALSRIPPVPAGTQILRLANNRIREFHLDSYRDLRQLDLHGNEVKVMLVLNHNGIERLNMSYNLLQTFRMENSNGLRTLDVSHNRLTDVTITSATLRTLYLHHNHITQLHHKSLNVPQLRQLALNQNPLRMLGTQPFSTFPRLRFLDVSNTKLRRTLKSFMDYGVCVKQLGRWLRKYCECVGKQKWAGRAARWTTPCQDNGPITYDVLRHQRKHIANHMAALFKATPPIASANHLLRRSLRSAHHRRSHRSLANRSANHSTTTVSPYKSKYTMPYDPLMGVYTASTLSSMLVMFLLCVLYYKVKSVTKRLYRKWRRSRSLRRKTPKSPIEVSDSIYVTRPSLVPSSDRGVEYDPISIRHIKKQCETVI